MIAFGPFRVMPTSVRHRVPDEVPGAEACYPFIQRKGLLAGVDHEEVVQIEIGHGDVPSSGSALNLITVRPNSTGLNTTDAESLPL